MSRRALLSGGLGAVVLTAAGVTTAVERRRHDGKLVPQLLGAAPFYVAHRGGEADWPDMSLEAYRRSVALGVDALEISLARSADGVWFGLHDPTLDRTSGTSGFVAADHTWAEISRHRISGVGTSDPGQAPQPYLTFKDLVADYARSHTIFVDPKVADEEHYPELLDLMAAAGRHPTRSFVAKGFCTSTRWAAAARARGYRTWGYYYGRSVLDGSTPLSATQASWDLLGMDVAGPPAAWTQALALGKPVVGHVVADHAAAVTALGLGAHGLMVSGVREVLAHRN